MLRVMLGVSLFFSAVLAGAADRMMLASTVFAPEQDIPELYTCEGKDLSPPLAWSGVPLHAQSLVLIVDDPDAPDPAAPKMTWVHWLVYNMPAKTAVLPEGASSKRMPPGTREGLNDFKRTTYGGPCPPVGRHRYVFKLYALDTMLSDLDKPSKAALENAMQGHVMAQTELVGMYAKRAKRR